MKKLNMLGWLVLSTAVLTGCSSDSADGGSGGSAGSASGGSSGSAGSGGTGGSAGTGGNTGGTGGTLNATRKCGDGAPCTAGAMCDLFIIESGVRCDCDPSGHFLCDSYASAGGPSFPTCNSATTEPCERDNGFCTRSCDGAGACQVACDGGGPAKYPDEIMECDLDYCAKRPNGACEVKAGATCDYTISCLGQAEPTVTGQCAE